MAGIESLLAADMRNNSYSQYSSALSTETICSLRSEGSPFEKESLIQERKEVFSQLMLAEPSSLIS